MMENKTYTATVDFDEETGEYVIPLPPDMCDELGWNTDDVLEWSLDEATGNIILSKKKKYFLIEAVSTFRMRYVVEQPNAEYAMDTVAMEEAKEFSQEHIGEQIISARQVSESEIIEICDIDNSYVKSWTDEQKFRSFVTEKDYKPTT
jgi:hypothetical protein